MSHLTKFRIDLVKHFPVCCVWCANPIGNEEVVKTLLEEGLDPSVKDIGGVETTPIYKRDLAQ